MTDYIDEACEFVRYLVMGGDAPLRTLALSAAAEELLKESVVVPRLVVYRGMYLTSSRLTDTQLQTLKSLRPGDIAPSFLRKRDNDYSSATKSLRVAEWYAKRGRNRIVLHASVTRSDVVVDLTNLQAVLAQYPSAADHFNRTDYRFLAADHEVILKEPIRYVVHSLKLYRDELV